MTTYRPHAHPHREKPQPEATTNWSSLSRADEVEIYKDGRIHGRGTHRHALNGRQRALAPQSHWQRQVPFPVQRSPTGASAAQSLQISIAAFLRRTFP